MDSYYCTDCKSYVDKEHRCQQWDTVKIIPQEALNKYLYNLTLNLPTIEIDCPDCKGKGYYKKLGGIHGCKSCKGTRKRKAILEDDIKGEM